jgi:hypothetical protein
MRCSLPLRLLGGLAALLLVAHTGISQSPKGLDPAIVKEIEDLEQRLQKLAEKLKALKTAATPASVPPAPASRGLPANLDKLLAWRLIGPANMSGRITGLAVYEADPTCYYVASASGGLLKTVNNGSTFTHQFDRESTVSIGAVAVAATNRDIVWVGPMATASINRPMAARRGRTWG